MHTEAMNRKSYFEPQIRIAFAFLETERKMEFTGVREIKDDPRDSGLVARYRNGELKVDIGWNESEMSLAVLIHFSRPELPRQISHIYLDSFVEFISESREPSTVPQIYPRMTEGRIFEAMKKRQELFAKHALAEILAKLANKLCFHFEEILKASADEIRDYHQWVNSGGKPSKEGLNNSEFGSTR